jgi:putative ABC transport system permease protein
MDILLIIRIALRSLERHKMRTLLTMLGIIIGIAAVVASVSFGQGANQMVQDQISNMGTNLLYAFAGSSGYGHIHMGWGSFSTLTDQDAQAIARDCSAVKQVSSGVEVGVQVVYGNQNWFTELNGVDVTFPEIRNWPMASGTFFSEEDVRRGAEVAVLGQTVVDELFGDEDPVGRTLRVKNLPFKVIGVLARKGQAPFGMDQDDRIEMPWTTAQRKIIGNTYLQFIAIQSVNRGAVELAVKQTEDLLRQRHHLRSDQDDDFAVRSMSQAAEVAASAGQVMTLLLASVASISLLVGGIGIMNIMLVSVTERTREIGIRLAIGAQPRDVLFQFLVEAVVLSILGGIIGILIGSCVAMALPIVAGWTTVLPWNAIALSFGVSAAIGMFFGIYPARKASQLDPIVALRYE